MREISGPRNNEISEDGNRDPKTIYSRIQSPGRRAGGDGQAGQGSGPGFGAQRGVLYEWVRKAGSSSAPLGSAGPQVAAGEPSAAEELRRLRRENANLKLENDILKKAAVILGTKPQQGAAR